MRRRALSGDGDWMPEHLRRFDPADWLAHLTAAELDPPASWEFPAAWWRDIRARDQWRDAGRAWLVEHSRSVREWLRMTRPVPGVDYEPIDG